MPADYAFKKAHPSSSAERAAHPLPYLHRCRKPRRPTAPPQCGGSCAAFEHAHVCTWGGFGGGLSPLGRLPPLTHVPGRLPSMGGVPRQGERWCPTWNGWQAINKRRGRAALRAGHSQDQVAVALECKDVPLSRPAVRAPSASSGIESAGMNAKGQRACLGLSGPLTRQLSTRFLAAWGWGWPWQGRLVRTLHDLEVERQRQR
jgi:hypothetical protein